MRSWRAPGPPGPTTGVWADEGTVRPLVHAADAAVLDLWLESDTVLEGTGGVDLLGHYLDSGLAVVALTHGTEATNLFGDEKLVTLPWPPDRREFVETLQQVLPAR